MKQIAGIDRFFHCDFKKGKKLGEWHFESGVNEVEGQFTLAKSQEVVLLIAHNREAQITEYVLDGQSSVCGWTHSETSYMDERGLQKAFRHHLEAGTHRVQMSCAVIEFLPKYNADLYVTLIYPEEVPIAGALAADRIVAGPTMQKNSPLRAGASLDGYRQGVGGGNVSIGRFGYTKGDGLLDCAMTTLGGVNRMHLFGHPLYKKTTRWQYSLLPKDIDPAGKYRGSFAPAENGIEGDEISINYLGSSWKTVFKRPSGGEVKFGCTYSLASAGIMVETDDEKLSLSELEYAGNYTRVLLPLEKGLTVRDISSGDSAYERMRDGEFKANWFLLFGTTAFPDIPIQVVMTRKPKSLVITRRGDGGLSGVDVETDGQFGTGFIVSPFGIESFVPGETLTDAFIADAASRCDFWSRAVLAYPVDAEEFYRIDPESEKVSIIQRFKHRIFKDEWGTGPLKTAPLPPALDLSLDLADFASDPDAIDFRFPTKYGYLKGVVNSDSSGYVLPLIPERRRINFRPSGDSAIADELACGFDEYWQFMEQFAPDEFPLSPYCASYLERYRFVSSMLNYLKEPYRTKLLEKLRVNLPMTADPDRSYQLLCGVPWEKLTVSGVDAVTSTRLFKDKSVIRKTFYNWYERREPFTGQTYKLTYVNCSVAHSLESGAKDVIERQLSGQPMIEVDWGTGLSLNAIALSALNVDGWESLRANWDTLKAGFKYFHLYQDWACMCASYTENGESWVEGSSYNGFVGFCRLAAALGHEDDLALGRYLGAKHGALRLAVFRSSYKYFPKFFRRSPWWITKNFHNECETHTGFLNAPDPGPEGERFREQGFFNFATEGAYPEIYMLFLKHVPYEFMDAWRIYRSEPVDFNLSPHFVQIECHAGYLLSLALSGRVTEREMEEEIAYADRAGVMVRDWFGLHYP
ncbi:MAG: hypothetical protein WAX69_01040, partial [Victivallales bacterium]